MSSDALARVRGGALDASFYFGERPEPDLASIELRDIVYHVTMPVAWAAELGSAPWEDLARRPWIVAPEPSTHRRLVMELFHAPTPSPERIVEADNESVINNLVESGVGVSLIRDEIATQSVDAGRSVIWPGVARDDEALARPSRRSRRRSAGGGAGRCAASRLAREGTGLIGPRGAPAQAPAWRANARGRRTCGTFLAGLGHVDRRVGATPAKHRQRGATCRQCKRRQRRSVAAEERDDSRHRGARADESEAQPHAAGEERAAAFSVYHRDVTRVRISVVHWVTFRVGFDESPGRAAIATASRDQ